MADSIRKQIVAAVITQLETITTVNGYNTDVGNSVYEWREYPVDESETPCLIVADTECETVDEGGDIHDHRLTIEIGIEVSGSSSAGDMRNVLADLNKAVGVGVEENWSNLAYNTEPVGDSTDMEHKERIFSDTIFQLVICFRTPAWNPYAVSLA